MTPAATAPAAAPHVPVLLNEVVSVLGPHPGETFLDGTVGLAGHAAALLARLQPGGRLLGLDRDAEALARAREKLAPCGDAFVARQANFDAAAAVLREVGWVGVDGALFDFGVSSLQLDTAERGFSWRVNAPLDMRMNRHAGPTAAEFIRAATVEQLAAALRDYGEVPQPARLARALKAVAAEGKLNTTFDLVAVVRRHGRGRRSHDAATLVFQALRIAVNDELGSIERLLAALPELLVPGGRAAFIAFHSLEDRLVKQAIGAWCDVPPPPRGMPDWPPGHAPRPCFERLTRRAVTAGEDEIAKNPRARSARLRAVRRLTAAEYERVEA